MMENRWGKERKINGESAMPIPRAGGEKKPKQNLGQMDGSLNYILFL
jgi:hypothetical protein